MTDKTHKTIWIKWVRSGIGFSHRQKTVLRSLGLRRPNHVVERPDTPQIRGLVARIHHLVAIVPAEARPAAPSMPEYTILPLQVAIEVRETPTTAEAAAGKGEATFTSEPVAEETEERVALKASKRPAAKASPAGSAKKAAKTTESKKAEEKPKGKGQESKDIKARKKR